MHQNRLHPVSALRWLTAILLVTTWGLPIAGLVTGNGDWYRWAAYVFAAVLFVAVSPLVLFVVTSMFEKK